MKDTTAVKQMKLAVKEDITMNKRIVELADIDTKFGLDKYDRTTLEAEVRTHVDHSAKSMLEAGRKLVLLKEHEGHGNFLPCLERINLSPRVAQRMMKAATKLIDLVTAKNDSLSLLEPSKIHELVLLDDEDLKELAENGTVANLSLDKIESMTLKEVKAECRILKQEKKDVEKRLTGMREANDQMLASKNKKLDDMEKELNVLTSPFKWQEKSMQNMGKLHSLQIAFSELISEFAQIVNEVEYASPNAWEQSQIVLIEQCKHSAAIMDENLAQITEQLKYLAPENNAVNHSLNDMKLTFQKKVGEI